MGLLLVLCKLDERRLENREIESFNNILFESSALNNRFISEVELTSIHGAENIMIDETTYSRPKNPHTAIEWIKKNYPEETSAIETLEKIKIDKSLWLRWA